MIWSNYTSLVALHTTSQKYHLSDTSAIKQYLMTKHKKDTEKLKSYDVRKILVNIRKIIYKNSKKNRCSIPRSNKHFFKMGLWVECLPMVRESSHTKDSKMVLNAALLSNQHYKVKIKGKVEQSREWSSPSSTLLCSSY